MSYSKLLVVLIAAAVATALWMPVQAGISVGLHGGYKGPGVHIGYRGSHLGNYQRHYRGHSYLGYRYHGYRHQGSHYRGHRYNRYRSYPYRSNIRYRTTPADPYLSEGQYSRHKTSSYAYTDGWEALAEGKSGQALSIFGHAAKSSPRDGVPKAGYALAMASAGSFDRGIWGMRRAFLYQPENLPELARKAGVHEIVDELIAHYEYELDDGDGHPDAAFMVAALNLLNGRPAAAQSASVRAAEAGDNSKSLRNLRQLLLSNKSVGSPANSVGDDSEQSSAGGY